MNEKALEKFRVGMEKLKNTPPLESREVVREMFLNIPKEEQKVFRKTSEWKEFIDRELKAFVVVVKEAEDLPINELFSKIRSVSQGSTVFLWTHVCKTAEWKEFVVKRGKEVLAMPWQNM